MSAKHTPGPWVWQHWPDGQNTVAEQSTLGTIANVWTSGAGVDIDKANARLLAAAPDLLEALKEAREGLRWYQDRNPEQADGSDDEALARIDAAIAKAEGSAL